MNFEDEVKSEESESNSVSAGPVNGYVGPSGGAGGGLGSYLKVMDGSYKSRKSFKKGAKGYSLRAGLESQMEGRLNKTKRSGWWTK